jgi:biopolymer transport protein ExbD
MNLVTILIPFLLMAAQFVTYAVIDSALPSISDTNTPLPPEDPLNLSISIRTNGLSVAARGLEPAHELPLRDGEYDVTGLRALLTTLKDDNPDEDTVILVPGADVPYAALVTTLDAAREDPEAAGDGRCAGRCLFPRSVMAGGLEAAD